MASSSAVSSAPTSTFTPALAPPPGVQSNPSNPASLAYQSSITIGICIPFVTIFFFCRSYVRLWIKRTWILEDWLAFIGWSGTVTYCALLSTTMNNHGGEHAWDITATQAQSAAYWFNVTSIEYAIIICITKIAVLCLYRRVFVTRRWSPLDITTISLIVILIGFYVATFFVKIFECNPREKIINTKLPGTCINIPMLLNTSGLFNTITDFIILFLPVFAVRRLRMSKAKKLLVVLVFTFGLCAPVFSTIGFVVRIRISNNPDTTWNQPEILLWAAAELATGNLCVCFPEMGSLFNRKARARHKVSGPTASILQGSGNSKRRKSARGTHITASLVANPANSESNHSYVELEEGKQYHVEVPPVDPAYIRDRSDDLDDHAVYVRHEVSVESYPA